MTYYLVLFVQPKPVPYMGAIKHKITKTRYELLSQLEEATIDCPEGNFSTIPGTKRMFAIEAENAAIICVDVVKNRKI